MKIKRMYYSVIPAHSGTSEQEIRKAKRQFLIMLNHGEIYGIISNKIQIRFLDVNYKITAEYYNENGEKIGESRILN